MISGVAVIPGISYHDAITTCVHLKPKYAQHQPRKLLLYNKSNYQGMNTDMSAFSSAFFKFAPDRNIVERNWKQIKSAFHDFMNKHIPIKPSKARDIMPWITTDIRRLIRKRRLNNQAMQPSGRYFVTSGHPPRRNLKYHIIHT